MCEDSQGNGPSQTEIDETLQTAETAFAAHDIHFVFCVENIVDDALAADPKRFLNRQCEMDQYTDFERINVLIALRPPLPYASGETNDVGGDRLWSKPGGTTFTHEFGHLLDLFHTYRGDVASNHCVANLPNGVNWMPGDPLSNANEGDLVADTPINPPNGIIQYTNCDID